MRESDLRKNQQADDDLITLLRAAGIEVADIKAILRLLIPLEKQVDMIRWMLSKKEAPSRQECLTMALKLSD